MTMVLFLACFRIKHRVLYVWNLLPFYPLHCWVSVSASCPRYSVACFFIAGKDRSYVVLIGVEARVVNGKTCPSRKVSSIFGCSGLIASKLLCATERKSSEGVQSYRGGGFGKDGGERHYKEEEKSMG